MQETKTGLNLTLADIDPHTLVREHGISKGRRHAVERLAEVLSVPRTDIRNDDLQLKAKQIDAAGAEIVARKARNLSDIFERPLRNIGLHIRPGEAHAASGALYLAAAEVTHALPFGTMVSVIPALLSATTLSRGLASSVASQIADTAEWSAKKHTGQKALGKAEQIIRERLANAQSPAKNER